jgi:hypothetical protein
VVPLFQRNYTWREKDWRTLFDNVLEVYEEGDPEERHFVGSIVTKFMGATPEGVSPFLVEEDRSPVGPRPSSLTGGLYAVVGSLRFLLPLRAGIALAPRLARVIHRSGPRIKTRGSGVIADG